MNASTAIKSIPILSEISIRTLSHILPYTSIKSVKKGEYVFVDRDEVNYIYFLLSGTTYFYKLVHNEEKRIIFIQSERDVLNIEMIDERVASLNCACLVDAKILCIEKSKFLQVLDEDKLLNKAVMHEMALRIRRLYHQMKNTVNMMRGDKKIASKLWKLAKDHGVQTKDGIEIDFPLSITFLAELVGSKRETVSRQMKILADLNLITISKKRVVVHNQNKLLDYINIP